MVRSRSEVNLRRRRCCGIAVVWTDISGTDCPDAVDGQGLPACVPQQPVKLSSDQVIGGDVAARLGISATRGLRDEKVVTEPSEIKGSQSDTPRSVQPINVFETAHETTCGTVNVHKAQARSVRFEDRTLLVQHIGDDDIVANSL